MKIIDKILNSKIVRFVVKVVFISLCFEGLIMLFGFERVMIVLVISLLLLSPILLDIFTGVR